MKKYLIAVFSVNVVLVVLSYILKQLIATSQPESIPDLAAVCVLTMVLMISGGHCLFGLILGYRYSKSSQCSIQQIMQLADQAFVITLIIDLVRNFQYSAISICTSFLVASQQAIGIVLGHGLRKLVRAVKAR